MEFGDIDFESLLKQQIGGTDARLDTAFIRHYWKEMAHCVEAVHKLNIVHSDLKPANFVLFRGKLKLIDFGIAGLINDHTVNVQRDHQVGTPNYMAPEALLDMNSEAGSLGTADKLIKIGKPSDIWSLGCILYQMVYGRTPFSGIRNHLKRALAIINPDHAIEYPEQGLGGITVPTCFIRSLQSCLHRDQYRRPTIAAILSPANHFFYPNMDTPNEIDLHQDQLGAILKNVVRECERDGLPNEAEVREWTRILFDKLRRVNAGQPSLEPLLPAG